jgi:hypothetical protein
MKEWKFFLINQKIDICIYRVSPANLEFYIPVSALRLLKKDSAPWG